MAGNCTNYWKYLFAIVFMLLNLSSIAQKVNFKVVDQVTNKTVANAKIKGGLFVSETSQVGTVSLYNLRPGDTVRVSLYGYKPNIIIYKTIHPDTIFIYLQPNKDLLREVSITGKRDYNYDSLKLRKDYSPVFAYKAPTWKDAIITISPYTYTPDDHIRSHNNTTEILSVNVLTVLSLFNKNKTPTSRLQRTLIKEEQNAYVDQLFSEQKISQVTALKNDSLKIFMAQYRPTVKQAKKMNEYTTMLYIKKSFADFIKTYKGEKSPFASKPIP